MRFNWRKWLDECGLAGKGILLAMKEKRFWAGFVISFIFFGTLMNLLSGGTAKFELMGALGFPEALKILFDNFLAIFGVNKYFLDWLPIFLIALLQGILIGLIVLLWDKKRASLGGKRDDKNGEKKSEKGQGEKSANSANVQRAGIITGLIALGAGCPTCGTTLITPLISAFVSTGSLAVAGAISTIVTWLAIILALFALKRLGFETYAIIINERYLEKHGGKK